MTRWPQLKPYFRYEISPGKGVFLLSEKGHFWLNGEIYIQLIPFLDGQHTETDIINCLKTHIPPAHLFYALGILRNQGHIIDESPNIPKAQAAFWQMLDINPIIAIKDVKETPISVTALGQINVVLFKTILQSLGVHLSDKGKLSVVLTDDYLQPDLETFNQKALTLNQPWLLAKPVGTELWLGPFFIPGKTGCWACLAHRLRGHRKIENYLAEKQIKGWPFSTAISVLPSTLQTAFTLTATEIIKWIGSGKKNHSFEGKMMTFNVISLEKHNHTVNQRPQCSICGESTLLSTLQTKPFILKNKNTCFFSDSGYRTLSSEQTFQQFEHLISPVTGIISHLDKIKVKEDNQEIIHSYSADHNFVLIEDNFYFLRDGIRSRCGGKGKLDTQAKSSALCESIERYSGLFQGDEARIQGKLKDLGSDAIHPNACMLFSEQQLQNREQWNAKASRFNWIPEPFDENQIIEWSPVWSLTNNIFRYLPTSYCYYGYARQHNIQFARADANGCAAGNTKEEAILQGFMELVERDSVALWWYNRLKKPAVDLLSFDEFYFQSLITYYQTLQRELWVLDITSDLNIPTFAAFSRQCGFDTENILFGFGAHFNPKIAILRAVTELNQFLPAIAGLPENRMIDHEFIEWINTATLENQPYLVPNETLPQKTLSDYLNLCSNDIYTDVMNCVQIVKDKELEIFVLDQTRPDIGLPVVKVIVPGLRHFWARFGPGRLYEVPVQMGWLDVSLKEEALNPQMIFI